MKVYYLGQEQELGRHQIVMANYDRDDFATPVSINVPYGVKYIDEISPDNKEICADLARYAVHGKYYIDNAENVVEVEGWQLPNTDLPGGVF